MPEPVGKNYENQVMGSDLITRYMEPRRGSIAPRVRGQDPELRQNIRDVVAGALPDAGRAGDIDLPDPKKQRQARNRAKARKSKSR